MGFKRLGKADETEDRSSPPKRFRKIEASEDSDLKQNKIGSVLSAGAKGLIRGSSDLGNIFGGEDTESEVLRDVYGANPEQLEQLKQQRSQIGEESLNKQLPSKEGIAESLAERTGRMIPGSLLGPGGSIRKGASLLGGALSGQIAEESGAGSWGQAGAEILGSALAGSPSGRLRPRAGSRQEQIIDTARRHGLSEREIAPAIQGERKIGTLAPIAHRGRGTVGRIHESRSALGRVYRNLENSPAGQQLIDPQQRASLLNELGQELQTVPHEVRDRIYRDAVDMLNAPPTPASLMDFYRDVNYQIGRGHRHLGGVRQILENHLTTHLGDDFSAVNELFGNVRRLGIRIRPDLASHFHDFRTAADLSGSILDGNKNGIVRAVGELLSRFTASKFLTSPYLQHLPRKVLQSAAMGGVEDAKKVLTVMLNKPEDKE